MTLHDEVSSWQDGWRTAPIYKAGVEWKDKGGKTHESDGKQPFPESRWVRYTPKVGAEKVVDNPDQFAALGIWFGPESDGLVCLDIDGDLDSFLQRHPSILDGAHIKSPKTDRAKVLFKIPKELWPTVKGCDNHTNTYQILWKGKMGVCAGEYGGGGQYSFVPGDVPVVPSWMLEEMQVAQARATRKADQVECNGKVYTYEEMDQKVQEWLSDPYGIPPTGHLWMDGEEMDSERFWWSVGACVQACGLGERGLELWSEWSQRDERYASDWASYDPCEQKWGSYAEDGGLGAGTLCRVADIYDPERLRMKPSLDPEVNKKKDENKENQYDEMMRRLREANLIEIPGRRRHMFQMLGQEYGYYSNTVETMENYIISDMIENKALPALTVQEIRQRGTAWKKNPIIPGQVYSPNLYVVWGEPNVGKTKILIALGDMVARGCNFEQEDRLVPVVKGKVLFFNSDGPVSDVEELFEDQEVDTPDFLIKDRFSFAHKLDFINEMQRHKPVMVIIDSLSASSVHKLQDENKSSYMSDLNWLVQNNGELWPAAAIFVTHHGKKDGSDMRGTGALRAALQDEWKVTEDSDTADQNADPDSRYITVGKSRTKCRGQVYLVEMDEAFKLSMKLLPKAEEKAGKAEKLISRVLLQLKHSGRWQTIDELVGALSIVRATDQSKERLSEGIRKALNRSFKAGQVEKRPRVGSKGRPPMEFSLIKPVQEATKPASRARRGEEECPNTRNSSDTNGSEFWDKNELSQKSVPTQPTPGTDETHEKSFGTKTLKTELSQNSDPLQDKGSGVLGQDFPLYKGDPFDSTGVTDCDTDEMPEVRVYDPMEMKKEVITDLVREKSEKFDEEMDRLRDERANTIDVDVIKDT